MICMELVPVSKCGFIFTLYTQPGGHFVLIFYLHFEFSTFDFLQAFKQFMILDFHNGMPNL